MKLSVVMATYNGEKYIKEQLDSIVPFLLIDDDDVQMNYELTTLLTERGK